MPHNNENKTSRCSLQLRPRRVLVLLASMYLIACLPFPYFKASGLISAVAQETEPSGTGETEPGGTGETEPGGTGETEPSGTGETEPSGTSETEAGSTTETEQGSTTETEQGGTTVTKPSGTTKPAAVSKFNTRIRKLSGGKWVKKGKWYYYRKRNKKYALNGLYKIKKKVYYLDSKGRRRFGWKKIEGVKYYFGKSRQGYMYRKTWASIGGKRYYFDETGRTVTGWQIINGKQYFFKKNGTVCTTSKKKDGVRFYFNKNGEVQRIGTTLNVASPCALIMEVDSGKIIYGKNPDLAHANASTTKIMTAILALENAKLSDTVQVSAYAASMQPTKLGMVAGDSFRLEDLLYSLLVASGNDTAVALAEHVSGSVSRFAAKMNSRAAALGCTNTHFVTPNGLDAGLNHYTSAHDLALMARHALKFSKFRQIVSTGSYSIRSNQGRYYSIGTTNALLGNMASVRGIKTGFTRKAGYCFVGLTKGKSGKEYITVDLGAGNSAQRWADARTLLGYAYSR